MIAGIIDKMDKTYSAARAIIDAANTIVILQADNPDGDSLASALALELILGDMGKDPIMVCGVSMPSHLQYLAGWDRVQKDLPKSFDATIIVDANTISLFDSFTRNRQLGWLKTKPTLVIDHHQTADGIDFASQSLIEPAVATGEIIYSFARDQNIPIRVEAMKNIVVSIMSDSLGLTSEGTTVRSIRYIADMVEAGVSLSELDDARRQLMKREPELLGYKGELLQRIELFDNGKIAVISIPWSEIVKYSPLYNPSMLVMEDMRMTVGVGVAIAFKIYDNGRVTAKIRCNPGFAIADKIAEAYGGGGHAYAAGFKITNAKDFASVKADCIQKATEILSNHKTKITQ